MCPYQVSIMGLWVYGLRLEYSPGEHDRALGHELVGLPVDVELREEPAAVGTKKVGQVGVEDHKEKSIVVQSVDVWSLL